MCGKQKNSKFFRRNTKGSERFRQNNQLQRTPPQGRMEKEGDDQKIGRPRKEKRNHHGIIIFKHYSATNNRQPDKHPEIFH